MVCGDGNSYAHARKKERLTTKMLNRKRGAVNILTAPRLRLSTKQPPQYDLSLSFLKARLCRYW